MPIIRKMTLIGSSGRQVIEVLVDTGATRTIVRQDVAEAVGLPKSGENKVFTDASGHDNPAIGGKLVLRYMRKVYPVYGFVSDKLDCPCLLGMDFLQMYKVRIDSRSQRLYFK
ncbi:MAG: retropepsin-like aspartic protease [Candidatus Micrarchaeota archaeon]|nr:retropepsin-like aspartic protease [Candidatus Micrarchaeota archaeon]